MSDKKIRIELTPTLLCLRCSKIILEGDPMAPTKVVKCPSCVAAELNLSMEPEVRERVEELNGNYALNMELLVKGFPTFHISLGESNLRKYIAAIDKHRDTGEATLDEGEDEK